MEDLKEFAKQFVSDIGTEAIKFNRKVGYDTGLNRQRAAERLQAGMAMIRRVLPKEGATIKDLLKVASGRFAELKRTIDAAMKEAPSISRFEKVIRVMGKAILDSAQMQDHLFELSGSFRRGFDILAERPKQPKKVEAPDDLLFTARERARVTKAILAFYDIIVSCGHDCYTTSSLLPDQKLPERIVQILARYRPDKSAAVTAETRKLIVGDTYFTLVKDGLWSYDGEFFRYLKRYFGAANVESIDPEDVLSHVDDAFLDLPLADMIASEGGKAMGLAILSAMSTGDGSPEVASARAEDAGREITNTVIRNEFAKGLAPAQEKRERYQQLLKEAKEIRQELVSAEEVERRQKAEDPQKAEEERLLLLKIVDGNIQKIVDGLAELDKHEAECREKVDELLTPPRDLAAFMPLQVPAGAVSAVEVPKGWSKLAGKTLKRKDGAWIKVEKDGVTLTCPTRMGETVRPRSYTMPNATQVEFLEPLLERFESGSWYKPEVNKAVWGSSWFSSGAGKQFVDDRHIVGWTPDDGREQDGERGAIRLNVPRA